MENKLTLPLSLGQEAYTRSGSRCKVIRIYTSIARSTKAAVAVEYGDGRESVYTVHAATGMCSEIEKTQRDVATDHAPFDWAKLWNNVPRWHRYITMDENGKWYSYSNEPVREYCNWISQGGSFLLIPKGYCPPEAADWKKSLTPRPH
jgi:hypothetical protein